MRGKDTKSDQDESKRNGRDSGGQTRLSLHGQQKIPHLKNPRKPKGFLTGKKRGENTPRGMHLGDGVPLLRSFYLMFGVCVLDLGDFGNNPNHPRRNPKESTSLGAVPHRPQNPRRLTKSHVIRGNRRAVRKPAVQPQLEGRVQSPVPL